MEHKNNWLNKARLGVVRLEARDQPGTLLTLGLTLDAVADVSSKPQDNARPALKRISDTNDVQIVNPAQASVQVMTAAPVRVGNTGTQSSTTNSQLSTSAPVAARTVAANPAIHTPSAGASRQFVAPGTKGTVDLGANSGKDLNRAPAIATRAAEPVRTQVSQTQVAADTVTERVIDCNSSSEGTKATHFLTYANGDSARADAQLDSAPGAGAQAGLAYGVGFHGRTGYITLYDADTGACATTVVINGGVGTRARVSGVAVNATGVYVTLNVAPSATPANIISSQVRQYPLGLGAAVNTVTYAQSGTGGRLELTGISTDPSGNVHVTGSELDPGLPNAGAYPYLVENAYTPTLGVIYDQTTVGDWDFGTDTPGIEISNDATNTYLGFALAGGGVGTPTSPASWALDTATDTDIWGGAWFWGAGGNTLANSINGMYGMDVKNGLGLMAGTLTDDAVDTVGTLLVGDFDKTTGLPVGYGFIYSYGGGLELTARGNASTPAGSQFTNGSDGGFNAGAAVDGAVLSFDPLGTAIAELVIGDGTVASRGLGGVSITTDSQVFSGGQTAQTAIAFGGAACDLTYNGGPNDGFATATDLVDFGVP